MSVNHRRRSCPAVVFGLSVLATAAIAVACSDDETPGGDADQSGQPVSTARRIADTDYCLVNTATALFVYPVVDGSGIDSLGPDGQPVGDSLSLEVLPATPRPSVGAMSFGDESPLFVMAVGSSSDISDLLVAGDGTAPSVGDRVELGPTEVAVVWPIAADAVASHRITLSGGATAEVTYVGSPGGFVAGFAAPQPQMVFGTAAAD